MTTELDWACDECGGSAKASWVILTGIQFNKALEYDRVHSTNEISRPISLDELMKLDDDRGTWSAMCLDHAGKFPEGGYYFETSRIDTHAKALDWTLHLLEKGWLQNTDWDSFLRSKVSQELDA